MELHSPEQRECGGLPSVSHGGGGTPKGGYTRLGRRHGCVRLRRRRARVYGDGQAELLAMAVDPAVRRRGVGGMLLRNLLLRLRQTERLAAGYRGTPEQLSAADAFFAAVWGGVPEDLGAVFRLRVGELADTPLCERFGYAGSGLRSAALTRCGPPCWSSSCGKRRYRSICAGTLCRGAFAPI
jgi:GNAT superfamily N-acetyltransferase